MNLIIKVQPGATPDYSNNLVPEYEILNGLRLQPAATSFIRSSEGLLYAYFFPTQFHKDPLLPGLEYIQSDDGSFFLSRVLTDVTMGSNRDFSILKNTAQGVSALALVDTGPEYSTGQDTWPFGHLWLATESDSGYVFQQLSDVAAFHHSVDTGDINNDGLSDIVVSHMGTKSGGDGRSVHAYIQTSDGGFNKSENFFNGFPHGDTVGAVGFSDVDGDGVDEIIVVNYNILPIRYNNIDWGAIRILSAENSSGYSASSTIAREGLFTSMGASGVLSFDYDRDGDQDLIIALEGNHPELAGYGHGIEIYSNNGSGDFERATESLLTTNLWSLFTELPFREFSVADINADGYQDIILNGWEGITPRWAGQKNKPSIDLAPLIFINDSGRGFSQLSSENNSQFIIQDEAYSLSFTRFVKSQFGETELFGLNVDGLPVTITLTSTNLTKTQYRTDFNTSTLVGSSATDHLIYSGNLQDYTITSQSENITVTKDSKNIDTLSSIERLVFSDYSMAFDIGSGEVGGSCYRIYKAAFNRIPDEGGLGYWIGQMDLGKTLVEVSAGFIDSDEFRASYGTNPTNGEFLTKVYNNVLGRDPDSGGYDWWVDQLTHNPEKTWDKVMADFSEGSENVENTDSLINNGISYDLWIA